MEQERARNSEAGMETIRRSLIWAALLMGVGIVLKGLIDATDFTYLMMVILTAWVAEQFPAAPAGKWAGPLAAVVIIAVAVAMRLVMEW